MRAFVISLYVAIVSSAPLFVSAQPATQQAITTNSNIKSFGALVTLILGYINLLIPLVFGLTFLVLGWGVVNAWIINADNAERVTQGKTIALWGIIGLAVMVGLWAIIAIVRTSFFGSA